MTHQPDYDGLIHALGGLVIDAGRVEAWLALTASMSLHSDEAARREAMAQFAKDRASDVLRSLKGVTGLPEEIRAILDELGGSDGLLEKRNRFIHAIWRETEGGSLAGMNLREAAKAVQSGALDQSLDVEQVERLRARLAEIAMTLGEWIAPTFGIAPR